MKRCVSIVAMFTLMLFTGFGQGNFSYTYYMQQFYDIMRANGDMQVAMMYVDEALKLRPGDPDALFNKAYVYDVTDDVANAVKYYSILLQKENTLSAVMACNTYFNRSLLYYELGDYTSALSDCNSAYRYLLQGDEEYRIDNEHKILSMRASVYVALNNYSAAEADYEMMLKINSGDLSAMNGLAQLAFLRNDYDEAMSYAEKSLLYDDKNNPAGYFWKSKVEQERGNVQSSINDMLESLAQTLNFENVDIASVISCFGKNREYALAKLQVLYAQNNEWHWAWWIASLYQSMYSYEAALVWYETLESQLGKSPWLLYDIASCYSGMGKFALAVRQIDDIISSGQLEERSDYSYAYVVRGTNNQSAGNYKAAMNDFDKAIEYDPSNGYAYYRRGWCSELQHDDEAAMQDYQKGIIMNPDYAYLYLMRGEQYLKQGKKDLAESDFETILKLDTIVMNGTCRQYALFFLGHDEEAIQWMDDLIESDPENAGHYYDKACLYARMGMLDESIAALEQTLEHGYRDFAHIEADDDLDPIRSRSEYSVLIKEYKKK